MVAGLETSSQEGAGKGEYTRGAGILGTILELSPTQQRSWIQLNLHPPELVDKPFVLLGLWIVTCTTG